MDDQFEFNQDTSWVVLEQGERFSPTQFLAFPFDESSSESDYGSSPVSRPRSRSQMISFAHHHSLTPSLALDMPHVPNSNEVLQSGSRMINSESALNLFGLNECDEIQSIFAPMKRKARANSCDTQNMEVEIADIDATNMLETFKQMQNNKLERQREHKRQQQLNEMFLWKHFDETDVQIDPAESQSKDDDIENIWIFRQCRSFLKLATRCTIPLTVTHVFAVLLGVYIGKSINVSKR